MIPATTFGGSKWRTSMGDGKSDLVTANADNDSVSILLGNGDGTFQIAADYGVKDAMPDAAIGDFNGDGRSDLAISSPSLLPDGGGAVSIMLGNGDGTFERKADYPAGRYDMSLAVGDFNGDGKDDLMMKEVNNLINWAPAVPFSISIAIGKGGRYVPGAQACYQR